MWVVEFFDIVGINKPSFKHRTGLFFRNSYHLLLWCLRSISCKLYQNPRVVFVYKMVMLYYLDCTFSHFQEFALTMQSLESVLFQVAAVSPRLVIKWSFRCCVTVVVEKEKSKKKKKQKQLC